MDTSYSKDKSIDRRQFLGVLGTGAVTTGLALSGCKEDRKNTPVSAATGEVPTDRMTYRTHPRTGDRVSLLGYGCMRWPMRTGGDGKSQEIDQDAVNELVDYAIAHGVNYFDTAPVYGMGQSEKVTGIALARHPRNKWLIATKNSTHRSVPPGSSMFRYATDMYRNSMVQLQTDYLDYYLLHGVGMVNGMTSLNERYYDSGVLDFLLKEREASRIRNLGFSFHGDIKVFDYLLAQNTEWDFVQIQLNYADWRHADGVMNTNAEYLYEELDKRNIPAVIMEPLLGGRLARLNQIALELLARYRPGALPAQWAFRFAGSRERVLTVLSGMTYMEHLQDNIRTYSPLEPLTESEYEILEKVAQIIFESEYISCTECQYCMPCPYGLDIPGTFAHYNRCISDSNMPKEAGDPQYRRQRRAYLVGYDRSVPKLRQANHCTACGQCTPKCTQRINIPAQMERIDRFVEQLKSI